MAGLVPAIHVFLAVIPEDVDARDKPGHDEERETAGAEITTLRATLSPPGRFIYTLLFAPMPLNGAGTVSGSFPSLCTAARMAAM